MSGLINKVKEKIAEVKADHSSSTHSTNAGPHNSNVANSADPRVDSDLDGGRHAGLNQTTGTHTTGTGLTGTHHTTGTGLGSTTGTHSTGTGIHSTSGIGSSGANTTTTAGPHSSDMMNKMDPRVDSDLSGGHPGSNAAYSSAGTTGTTGPTFGTTGTHSNTGYGSTTHGSTTHGTTTTAGPHSSDMMNKMDPRVDSDLSGGHPGANTAYTGTGTTGSTFGTTGHNTTNTHGSTNAGPHSSNAANYVDPRVDSDLDGSRNAGLNQTTGHYGTHSNTGTGIGSTGTYGSSTTAGPHSSNMANKMDPRVDSDLDRSNNAGLNQHTRHDNAGLASTTSGSGPVHNSSLLNKLDPRVDSDADGSRNAGMSQTSTTHNVGSSTHASNQPLDAARHGPSAFREVHGDPSIHHDFPEDAAHARHGSVSKSDQHYGSGIN